jgi:alpha-L-fucosidase
VLDAYREKGFSVGTYFSKPDWHSQYYWWDVYGKKGRNVNYPVSQYPQRWARFRDYTQRQLQEILSRYGQVDILWLDGGWVNKNNMGQDIDMPAIAKMARRLQPGILIVDRTIHGPYENYQTPENTIPATQLDFPWESCITLTNAWGWVPNPTFKSSAEVLGMLIEIVAKGGNLVLGIGPTAGGLIEDPTVERLKEMGKWLKANGEAIYGTTITPHYNEGDIWFTKAKEGSRLYAIYRHKEGTDMPTELTWSQNLPQRRTTLLSTGKRLKYSIEGGKVKVVLPKNIQAESLALAIE